MAGRPSKYTPVLAERICELIAQGKSKNAISKMEEMPSRPTIDEWLLKHKAFSDNYARACEIRAELYAEEIVDIADREDLDSNDKRVRIDARKWIVSKLLPRQYGDSVTLKGDPKNPVRHTVELSRSELMTIAAGEKALDA